MKRASLISLILVLSLLLTPAHTHAAGSTYYVSPSGSDSADGTAEDPWKTLEYASTQATGRGDTIQLSAGTYTLTAQVYIAPGVSLIGAGADATVIVSSLTDNSWGECAAVNLSSDTNTDGDQRVSGILFDGSDRAGDAALRVQNRNNVEVDHCEFADFEFFAVGWRASDTGGSNGRQPPSVYVEGGSFHDNVTNNCAGSSDWYRGALLCGGIYDFEIYNNHMVETGRARGTQGWPIKFWYYCGWMVDCKIYGNYLEKTDNSVWPFTIESNYSTGMEIYDNTIVGAVDINNSLKSATVNGTARTYAYGLHLHDNIIGPAAAEGVETIPMAVVLEERVEGVLVENNVIRNSSPALLFTPRAFGISDVTFRYNICTGIIWRGPHNHAIRMMGSGTSPDVSSYPYPEWTYGESMAVEDFAAYGNVFQCTEGNSCFGVQMDSDAASNWHGGSFTVKDNIFANFGFGSIMITNFTALAGTDITGNLLYNSGDVWADNRLNDPVYFDGTPAGTVADNTECANSPGAVFTAHNGHVAVLVKNGTGVPSPCTVLVKQYADGVPTASRQVKVKFAADGYFGTVVDFGTGGGTGYTYTAELVGQTAPFPVTGITVTSAADALTAGQTMQMRAEVLPANADNAAVRWSVINGTGAAEISSAGVLRGTAAGTVTVRATAADGSGVYGETVITVTAAASSYTVTVDTAGLPAARELWIDGARYSGPQISISGTSYTVELRDGTATNAVVYTYNSLTEPDPHKVYPTGMYVWLLRYENGAYTAVRTAAFDNLLRYAGSSIRITGTKGIRMITSIATPVKKALTGSGLAGYTLEEYGTAVAWTGERGDGALVLGRNYTKEAYAYRKGVSDPVYQQTRDLTSYTNVLVGFDNAKCVPDLAMRPYMILADASGRQLTLYGGVITRSIGYIAYQNRAAFASGTAAYRYIWDIIHHVYGSAYDADYRS